MACDTRAYAGFNAPLGMKVKIRQHPNGGLIGVTTNTPGLGEAFLDWACDPRDDTPFPEGELSLQAIAVEPTGEVFYYYNSLSPSGPLEAPFYAIGSGALAAMGALHAGASIEQSVEIASFCDVWTGGPVRTLRLGEKSEVKSRLS